MLNRLSTITSKIGNTAAICALIYMFLHIILEIILRNAVAKSTFVLDEFVGYAVSGLTFLALGETLRNDKLIRVTLLLEDAPAAARRLLEIFGYASALAVGCFGAWYIGKSVIRNFVRGTTSSSIAEVPQWIPESFVLLGLIIFTIQALVSLIVGTARTHRVT